MSIMNIDGYTLKKMIISGANVLSENKGLVDSLNVFPVPDGDTGTNMSLTLLAAAKDLESMDTADVYKVAKAISSGSLRGARGNSGVILSQLFRGFAKALEEKSVANTDDLAEAFARASEVAEKAVMKPKEGTILTVARSVGEKALELALDVEEMESFFREIIRYGNQVLDKTTNMLPELKAANVVDAGGKGFLLILEGMYNAIGVHEDIVLSGESSQKMVAPSTVQGVAATAQADIHFGYCTEFFIHLAQEDEEAENHLKSYLTSVGDSIVVVADDGLIKVHVHTNHPGNVLEKALSLGHLSNLKIENMRIQHSELISFEKSGGPAGVQVTEPEGPAKDIGFVAVVTGDGIKDLFLNLGADQVIEGGQSMNPSTEDILSAVEKVNAPQVVVFPNNKNIILAVQQAAELSKDKKIWLVPSKNIPQGLAALLSYGYTLPIETNIEQMKNAMAQVKTGQITYAVRDTAVDGKEIVRGDILCMLENQIEYVAKSIEKGAKVLIDRLAEEGELLSIYYGQEVSGADAEALVAYIREKYPEIEVECHEGKQPLYYYILSAE